jgi:perosamine synthetase
MEAINAVASEYNLVVVEDAAEAFMSKHNGKFLGTWGHAGAFSLSIFNLITAGQGGFIVTDDETLYTKLRELRNQGLPAGGQNLMSRVGRLFGIGASGTDEVFNSVGYNFKTSNVLAALALGQLTQLDFRMNRARQTYKLYAEHLAANTINLFPFNIEAGELPLWIDCWSEKRDELDVYLKSKNIEGRKYWLPAHQQKIYKGSDENFPVASSMSPKSYWLPSAFTLKDEDVVRVCKEINAFFGK